MGRGGSENNTPKLTRGEEGQMGAKKKKVPANNMKGEVWRNFRKYRNKNVGEP